MMMAAPVPIVFDHFGGTQAALGVGQPGFDTLLKLVKAGKAYVKISAPYRSSTMAPDYPDVAPLTKALIAANVQRMLWATDWPHPAQIPAFGFAAAAAGSKPHGDDLFAAAGIKWQMSRELRPKIIGINEVTNN